MITYSISLVPARLASCVLRNVPPLQVNERLPFGSNVSGEVLLPFANKTFVELSL